MNKHEHVYEAKTRITYYDLDLRGSLKLSAFLRMVHIAADANAHDLGIGFERLSPMGISFVLQRFGLGIKRTPAYNEAVTLRTWPDGVSRGTFLRKGDMYDERGEKIMEWASLWILFDVNARKILKPSVLPVTMPDFVDLGVKVSPNKIELPPDFGTPFSSYTHTARYAEVDTNIHMNNSIYGDLIGNALFPGSAHQNESPHEPGLLTPDEWSEVQINYLTETRMGEDVQVSARYADGTYLISGAAEKRTTFNAMVKLK